MEEYKLKRYQEAEKRFLDIVISIFTIIVTLPIMVIISVLIKLDSKGKVIYKQKRITKNGKEFVMYKFRTMIEDAEKNTGPIIAIENDTRITRVGKILRKTRLDELPQFFNVLKGDMSIVGPRPERIEILNKIVKDVPNYRDRENVKAGITCIAHIKGDYYTEPKLRFEYDKEYMKDWSIKKDIKIIFETIKKVSRDVVKLKQENSKASAEDSKS